MQKRTVKRLTVTYTNGRSYTVKNVENFSVKNTNITFTQKSKHQLDGEISVYREEFFVVPTKNILQIFDESRLGRKRLYNFKHGEIDTMKTYW